MQAGAAATLMGLVFVAASINLSRILTFPGLPGRALESILQLLEVFLICTLALVPGQADRTMAIEFIAIGAIFWLIQIAGQVHYLTMRSGHPWSWFVHRAVLGQFATVPFSVAGVMLWFGNCYALYWLVPGLVFSFVASLVSAWVLLVEVQR